MNKSSGFLLFIFGTALGSFATWKIVKSRYEAIAQEEIDSVKRVYSSNTNTAIKSEEKDNEPMPKKEIKNNYTSVISDFGYGGNNDIPQKSEVKEESWQAPYIITPDEFAINYEYDTIDVTYFADGVLADENNEPLEDIENTIGKDAVNHFGEYETDIVYVRNDRLKADYEIVKDERNYSDVRRR